MIDKGHIGVNSGERLIDVEHGQLKLFCKAIGETNPIFWDADAARAAGYPNCPVPPTFPLALTVLAPAKVDLVIDVLGASLGRILHGAQGFKYHHPIYAGDRVKMRTSIADIYARKNGALEFIVQETSIQNQNGLLCCTINTTIVVRN